MGNSDYFMNGIILAAGAYLIFSALRMKLKKEVGKSLLSRNIDWDKAPDKEGYIRLMAPINLLMGLLMIGVGVILSLHDKLSLDTAAQSVVLFVALAICLAYGVVVMNAQNRFLK